MADERKSTQKKTTRRRRARTSGTRSSAAESPKVEASKAEAEVESARRSKRTATQAEASAPPQPTTPPKPPIKQVVLRNMMSQMLLISVVNDGGVPQEVRLAARATYGPVPEANLTGHTRRLAQAGHLKITKPTR